MKPVLCIFSTTSLYLVEIRLWGSPRHCIVSDFRKNWNNERHALFNGINEFLSVLPTGCGPGSSVGIATELRPGRSRIECRWGRDFPPVQTGPGAHPAFCTMGTGSFLGVTWDRGVLLPTHPLLVPRSWKSRAIPLPTLWATPGL